MGGHMQRRGFTLIELLIVMALISLLLSVAVPRYFGHVDKARETVLRQDLAQLRDAIDKYYGDIGRYPESLDELVTRKYLRKLPTDPFTERADSWIVVAPEKKESGNVFDVKSGASGLARDGSDYASW
ncbi:MAG: prepilin-type N-terminal cleavage/methylation domain-containing protein [Pseudomonadota bacterium]